MTIQFLNNKNKGITPNIFIQETEPEIKEGIWIKKVTDNINKILVKDQVINGEEWNSKVYSTPPINFNENGGIDAIGSDIYIIYGNTIYKYNSLNDTYIKLDTTIPISLTQGSIIAVGTDIYLFGGNNNNTSAYKYDTINNTYSQLTNIPFQFYSGSIATIGTYIYVFGGIQQQQIAYKYDTINNSYTQLTNIPFQFRNGSAIAVGTNIYLFGGTQYKQRAYKYDTINNSYTRLTDIPFGFARGSVAKIDTDIYLFGGMYESTYAYKYNTDSDTYKKIEDMPYSFQDGGAININNEKIYVLWGTLSKKMASILLISKETYPDKSVVIKQGSSYSSQILPTENELIEGRLVNKFDNVWYNTTENGLDDTLPTYYGAGTEWVKFKN